MNKLFDEISIIWSIDDIKERDDQGLLTDNDCKIILQCIKHNHDASIGINWDVIDVHIENYLSEKNNENL